MIRGWVATWRQPGAGQGPLTLCRPVLKRILAGSPGARFHASQHTTSIVLQGVSRTCRKHGSLHEVPIFGPASLGLSLCQVIEDTRSEGGEPLTFEIGAGEIMGNPIFKVSWMCSGTLRVTTRIAVRAATHLLGQEPAKP